MNGWQEPRQATREQWLIMGSLALVSVLAHALTNGNYGIFRDELYYWDSTRHLAWGYVDHPPLSIAVLKLSVTDFGDSLGALRIVPSLCGAALVILVGLMSVEFGANRFGVLVASLSALTVPVYIVNTGYYSMNALDLVLWALLFFVLIHIRRACNDRLWLFWGVILGLTALNKLGVAALVVTLLPGLIIGGWARALGKLQFWAGLCIAGVMMAPFVTWQVIHDWPTLEFIRNATSEKIVAFSFVGFVREQILPMGPALLPVWAIGLFALLVWRPFRPYRFIGLIWLGALLFFGLQHSKPYYLSPAYGPLYAAGATAVAQWIRPLGTLIRIAATAGIVFLLVGGAFDVAPLTLPIYSPDKLAVYMEEQGIAPAAAERGRAAVLPQYLADRFGWKEMTASVAVHYKSLPDSLRGNCTIVARNYGEAGALNYYGRQYGLPRVLSQHNSHYLWGYGDADGSVILTVNYDPDELRHTYSDVTVLGTCGSDWAMPFETDVPICLCTGLLIPWAEAWQSGKLFL